MFEYFNFQMSCCDQKLINDDQLKPSYETQSYYRQSHRFRLLSPLLS